MSSVIRTQTSVKATTSDLRVDREDIVFFNTAADRVRIEITVHNTSAVRSTRTPMRVQVAAFGAFLPWRPLKTLSIPPIAPHGRLVAAIEARPDDPVTAGSEGTPPQTLLTAIGAEEPPRDRRTDGDRTFDPIAAILGRRESMRQRRAFASPQWTGLQWAGNINVFLGPSAVERHMARALRVHAGSRNGAVFTVGGPDVYAFELLGDGPAWGAELYDFGRFDVSAGMTPEQRIVGEFETRSSRGHVLLVMTPPAYASEGNVVVQVEQRSTSRVALVEFDLDANAVGPGCYTL